MTQSHPVIEHLAVTHVGTLDRDDKSSQYASSYKGLGLSVSNCPGEWTTIARLGGQPTWNITRVDDKSFRFLDAHEVQPSDIKNYCIDNGYVVEVTGWRVEWEDSETDETNWFTFLDRTEALEEADHWETDPIKITVLAATGLLGKRTGASPGEPADHEHMAVVFAEDTTDLDGVWWSDRLGVARLSAPRGTLFERAQATMAARVRQAA